MNSASLIQRLHQHRAWVNDNLLTAMTTLSDAQLRQSFLIGQGSIWQSLLHLYAAEYVWLAALQGKDDALVRGDLPGKIPGNQQGEGAIKSLAELRDEWSALQKGWDGYLVGLTSESLDEMVYRRRGGSTDGKRFGTRRADVLLHVCTHAHYTTAQVVNMLRQIGVEKLPDTMLIALARQESFPV
ncbi:MAG TPA: DinB family protein [Gemmataceae bacterium]|jgi:uncharacterized damage-inducible protein DinB|nr:DinB family protein [Gemmataceae bacterium]